MLEDNLKIAQIIQAIITSAGVIIAALSGYVLFVRQREAFPRVKISHRLRYDRLENSQALISLDITVANVSKVRVTLAQYHITVAQMLPPEDELKQFISAKLLDQSKYGLDISQWKILATTNKDNNSASPSIELEPGEFAPIPLNFLVRDSATLIQVTSEFPNNMRRRKTLRWVHRTIYDVKQKEGELVHVGQSK